MAAGTARRLSFLTRYQALEQGGRSPHSPPAAQVNPNRTSFELHLNSKQLLWLAGTVSADGQRTRDGRSADGQRMAAIG